MPNAPSSMATRNRNRNTSDSRTVIERDRFMGGTSQEGSYSRRREPSAPGWSLPVFARQRRPEFFLSSLNTPSDNVGWVGRSAQQLRAQRIRRSHGSNL